MPGETFWGLTFELVSFAGIGWIYLQWRKNPIHQKRGKV
jgi:hypothetical protein